MRTFRAAILAAALGSAGHLAAAPAHANQAGPPPPEALLESSFNELAGGLALFHSYQCRYCKEELAWLEGLASRFPGLEIRTFEIARPENGDNRALFEYTMRRLGSGTEGVPRTVISGRVFIGFLAGECELSYNEVYRAYNGCESAIASAARALAPEPASASAGQTATQATRPKAGPRKYVVYNNLSVFLLVPLYLLSLGVFKEELADPDKRRLWKGGLVGVVLACLVLYLVFTPQSQILRAARGLPFPAFVAAIALADGFNPCSFSMLAIFLSLLTYTKARRDLVLVGGTFVLVSALMYAAVILSMTGLAALVPERFGRALGLAIGAIVLAIGLANATEPLRRGRAPVIAVSPKRKALAARRFGGVVEALKRRSPAGAALAVALTAVLAAGVSLMELGCTAILPAVYMTSLLAPYGREIGASHVAWTAFYAAVYALPLAAILADFTVAFRSRRMTEGQGKTLKAVGGLVMAGFAVVMILKPEWLSFA